MKLSHCSAFFLMALAWYLMRPPCPIWTPVPSVQTRQNPWRVGRWSRAFLPNKNAKPSDAAITGSYASPLTIRASEDRGPQSRRSPLRGRPWCRGLIGGARWILTAGPARFGRKRRRPASFGSLSAPLGAPEADRRTTGFWFRPERCVCLPEQGAGRHETQSIRVGN